MVLKKFVSHTTKPVITHQFQNNIYLIDIDGKNWPLICSLYMSNYLYTNIHVALYRYCSTICSVCRKQCGENFRRWLSKFVIFSLESSPTIPLGGNGRQLLGNDLGAYSKIWSNFTSPRSIPMLSCMIWPRWELLLVVNLEGCSFGGYCCLKLRWFR